MAKSKQKPDAALEGLRAVLDERAALYKNLRDAANFSEYVSKRQGPADEEQLTEPVLATLMERVLGFPKDGYFQQQGKGGLKPDFTPLDLIGHPFVLDAKGTGEDLAKHEKQIRGYVNQRHLDFGVLFNLREIRVYRRGEKGHAPELSFKLLPLWELVRGEALPAGELELFERFQQLFAYRVRTLKDKIKHVREQRSWAERPDDDLKVDVEYLVELLRRLSRDLVEDAAAQFETLETALKFNPGRAERIVEELRMLANDISPGVDLDELPDDVRGWRQAEGLPGRAWNQYLLRVSYLALARILLYRSWEDVQFADQYLYDGGFDLAYERLSRDVNAVLRDAFHHGADRYHWLFGSDNNYDWYRPREGPLVEVLYSLAPVPLGKLDADALGGLYVSYVDEIDRDRLGQFFTPRPVVKFMLDRAGYDGPEGVFKIEGDERKPRRVLDFATGSGGFLVEAARRIIDEGGIDRDDARSLEEALAAIATGFVGGEISPFPYYLTEVNLLLQVSRLLGDLKVAGKETPPFVLGVLHVDTLTAKSASDSSLNVDPALRRDAGELVNDERFDLVPLDGEKLATYRNQLRKDGEFELVVGNPPYVAEANNKPLFDRLRAIPAWTNIYKGKTDYLYYFLWLAVEKLAPGGRLCVITPAAWMNAGAAAFLREKLAGELTLEELFLFGDQRLFAADQGPAPTPTVESAILVATKGKASAKHKVRVVVLEDLAAAGWPNRDDLLAEMANRAKARSGRRRGILAHSVSQSELEAEYPWPVKFPSNGVHMRVVRHLKALLADEAAPVEPLIDSWKVFTGIETAADAYTARIRKNLPTRVRREVEKRGIQVGESIMELPAAVAEKAPWSENAEFLAPSPEPRAVLYGALDDADKVFYVVIDRGDDAPREVRAYLERWRPILEHRAEIRRNEARRWFETAWPRDRDDLAAPKVIALYRTDRGRFALDEAGEWRPGKKSTVVVGRQPDAPVAYLCGLLNSELLDIWYAVRGKAPRDVWRNYEPKRMNEMPYCLPQGDPRVEEIADRVRKIASNRRALLPHRAVVRDLMRIVKDPWKTGTVKVDPAAVLSELPKAKTVSVRLDPTLELSGGKAPLGSASRPAPGTLVFHRAKVETARVDGDPNRIALLAR